MKISSPNKTSTPPHPSSKDSQSAFLIPPAALIRKKEERKSRKKQAHSQKRLPTYEPGKLSMRLERMFLSNHATGPSICLTVEQSLGAQL